MTLPTERPQRSVDSTEPNKRDNPEYLLWHLHDVDDRAQMTVEGFIRLDWRGENKCFKPR
jgi:hypothetical protein